jgi:hypothetical protein
MLATCGKEITQRLGNVMNSKAYGALCIKPGWLARDGSNIWTTGCWPSGRGMPFAKTENGSRLSAGSNRCDARDFGAIGCPRHSQAVTKVGAFVVCRLTSLDACAGGECMPRGNIGVALAAAGLPAT